MTTFYKLVFDISYFYVFAAYFIFYDSGYTLNPLNYGVLVTAFLLATVAEKWDRGRAVLLSLSLVFPAIALCWEHTSYGLVTHLLPWGYFLVITLRRGVYIQYGAFRNTFRWMFVPFIFPFAFFYFNVQNGYAALMEAAPYLILFLVSGVLLLQNLRHEEGSSDKKKFERYQMKQTVVFFVLSLAVTAGHLAEWLGNFVYLWIIRPIVAVILRIFWEIVSFLLALIPERKSYKLDKEFVEYVEEFEKENVSYFAMKVQEEIMEQDFSEPSDYTLLFAIIGIIAAIVAFAILMGSNKKKKALPELFEEREELPEEAPPVTKLKKRSLQPEIVVRFHYRDFMRMVNGGKQKVMRSDTTAEIADKYGEFYKAKTDQARELTELYRKARYSGSLVTRQEAARAKKMMKEL